MWVYAVGLSAFNTVQLLGLPLMRRFSRPFQPLSIAARKQSMRESLAAKPEVASELVIFGYASLMWAPDIPHRRVEPARLPQWRRSLSVWTTLARGTLCHPGLALGLVPGGLCEGMAFFVPESGEQDALERLWAREMWTDIYRPTWVTITAGTEQICALTFTVNTHSLQYAGEMPLAEKAAYIALASGERGPCRDYMVGTVDHLRQFNIIEDELEAVLALSSGSDTSVC